MYKLTDSTREFSDFVLSQAQHCKTLFKIKKTDLFIKNIYFDIKGNTILMKYFFAVLIFHNLGHFSTVLRCANFTISDSL